MPEAQYSIGLDMGTSSVKALAISPEGLVLQRASRDYPVESPAPGFQQQDPERIYEAILDVLAELVSARGSGVEAVAFSSAMHSVLPVDGEGNPIGPCLIWSDNRSKPQADRLHQSGLAQDLYAATGTPVHPMSPLCKILWWKEEKPDLHKRASRFISLKSLLWFRWFGTFCVDYSEASASGLFDIVALAWHEPALRLAGLEARRLPLPVSTRHMASGLTEVVSRRTGLPAHTPVMIGAGDGCLANLGSGISAGSDAVITLGTSAAIRLSRLEPMVNPSGSTFNYILQPGHFICGGPSNNGGNLLPWFAEAIGWQGGLDALLHAAMEVPPGARGLMALPYLLGERAPVWDASARGAWIGLNARHRAPDLLRALLEGMVFNLVQIAALLERKDERIRRIFINGGMSRSEEVVQLVADIFGCQVEVDQTRDASALGAVLLCRQEMGKDRSIGQGVETGNGRRLTPDPRRHAFYLEAFQVYSKLYPALRPFHKDLEALASKGEQIARSATQTP